MGILATIIRLLLFMGLHRLAAPWPYENEDECIRDTSCDCSFYSESTFEIECPLNKPIVAVSVFENEVEIICDKDAENVYSKLPNMTLGDMEQVIIDDCPFASNDSFKMILNHLGIQKTRELILREVYFPNGLFRQHLSGLEELEHLTINNFNLDFTLSDDIFDNVGNLKSLKMTFIENLPNNIFQNLPKLEFIELSSSNLENLTSGIFLNQRKLKRLSLKGNNIKKLTKGVFEGASSILELNLSDNIIDKFPADVFIHLTNVSEIDLSWNSFTLLPPELFKYNKNLSHLLLNNNQVSLIELPPSFLSNLPKLEHVSIFASKLNSVLNNLFHGSTKIVNISLSYNKLPSLSVDLFANQSNLLRLDLSYNQFDELDKNLFATTTSLEVLDLSFNKIFFLESSIFRNLRNLHQLFLNDNQLYTINDSFASMADSLINLQLQDNYFDNFIGVDNLKKLQILNLRHNSIARIEKLNSSNLTELDLSNNKIESFDVSDILSINSFIPVNLTIDLSQNRVETIDFTKITERQQNGSGLGNHIKIILDNNPLRCNCKLLDFIQFVRNETGKSGDDVEILLGDLRCAEPEEMFDKIFESVNPMDLICPLDSPDSDIRHCPESCECKIRPADKAMIINCSSANLSAAPNLPNPMKFGMEFTELFIDNNNITALPSKTNQSEYNYVTKICANHNRIGRLLPENFPDNLSTLELANNQLTSVNSSVLDGFNKTITLTRLLLGHNPWICDCSAKDLYYYAKKHHQQIADLGNISCPNLAPFLAGYICPEYEFVTITIMVVIASLIGLVIGLLVALYYKYQRQANVWLFTHNLCLRFITEEDLDKDKKYDAFISYSHKDVNFLVKEIVPYLEESPHQYKLCLHDRDWLAGAYIPDSIARSVDDSRRTIIILSPNFLGSVWANMEFRVAHTNALLEGRAKVVVVIYGDIGDTANLDSALKSYLKTNTYVKWGDPFFWKKLSYAMPHPKTFKIKTIAKTRRSSIIRDQLELRSF